MQGPAPAREDSHSSSSDGGGTTGAVAAAAATAAAAAGPGAPVTSLPAVATGLVQPPTGPTAAEVPQQAAPGSSGSESEFGAFDGAQASSSSGSGDEFGAFDDAALPAEAPPQQAPAVEAPAAAASSQPDLLALPPATFQTAAAALLSWLLPPGQLPPGQRGAALQASSSSGGGGGGGGGSSLPALHSTGHAAAAGLPAFEALASRFPQLVALAAGAAGLSTPAPPSWHGSCAERKLLLRMVGPPACILHLKRPIPALPV